MGKDKPSKTEKKKGKQKWQNSYGTKIKQTQSKHQEKERYFVAMKSESKMML